MLSLLVGRDLVSLRRLYEPRLQYQSVPKFLLRDAEACNSQECASVCSLKPCLLLGVIKMSSPIVA